MVSTQEQFCAQHVGIIDRVEQEAWVRVEREASVIITHTEAKGQRVGTFSLSNAPSHHRNETYAVTIDEIYAIQSLCNQANITRSG